MRRGRSAFEDISLEDRPKKTEKEREEAVFVKDEDSLIITPKDSW